MIEVIVYLALFAILMTGAIVTAYSVFKSAGRNQARATLQQEGDFLEGKIDWVLSGASYIDAVSLPADGVARACDLNRPLCLSVTKYNSTVVNLSLVAPSSCLQSYNGSLLLWYGTACPVPVNTSNVQISNLQFTHTAASGTSIEPESVSASFSLTDRTDNGMLLSSTFSITKYLRK